MIHLHVWLRPHSGSPQRVGEILVSDPDSRQGSRMRGEFRYTSEYLENADAFPLDPIHLLLESTPITAEDPATGLHGVFEDSLPDAWGRAILCHRHNIPRQKQRAAYLLEYLGSEAMGALSYTPSPQ